MSYGEACRLTFQLSRDPTSAVGAALAGWEFPMSHAALLLADLYDLTHAVNATKKPKPHPLRPFPLDNEKERRGNVGGRSRERIEAILRAARAGTSDL